MGGFFLLFVSSYFEGSSCDRFCRPLSGGLQVRALPGIVFPRCVLQQSDLQKNQRETLSSHNSTPLKNVSHDGYEFVLAF